jgi:hypothetical protein
MRQPRSRRESLRSSRVHGNSCAIKPQGYRVLFTASGACVWCFEGWRCAVITRRHLSPRRLVAWWESNVEPNEYWPYQTPTGKRSYFRKWLVIFDSLIMQPFSCGILFLPLTPTLWVFSKCFGRIVTWWGVTIDGFWIDDRIYWTVWYSVWLHFTVHCYTHVSTVVSSPLLLGSGFQRRAFPFLWVSELSPASATSSSQQ